MPILEWNDSLILGIKKFDEHHLHLVELLNDLYDRFKARDTGERIGSVLDELIFYATYHFNCEESMMAELAYPDYEIHIGEHQRFIKRVLEIQQNFHNSKINVTFEVLSFLKNWLTNHILDTDVKFGAFVVAKR